jgi:hypothetical protein
MSLIPLKLSQKPLLFPKSNQLDELELYQMVSKVSNQSLERQRRVYYFYRDFSSAKTVHLISVGLQPIVFFPKRLLFLGATDLNMPPQTNRMRFHNFFCIQLETKKAQVNFCLFFAPPVNR